MSRFNLTPDPNDVKQVADWLAARGERGEHQQAAWEVVLFCTYADIAASIQTHVLSSTDRSMKAIDRYSDRLTRSSVPVEQLFPKEVSGHVRRKTERSQEAG